MNKKFLNQVAQMAKEASEVTSDLLKENEELKKRVASAENVEKKAAEDAETVPAGLSEDAVERVVDHIIQAGKAKEASRDELVETFTETPDKLVDYVEKLAQKEELQPAPRLGKLSSGESRNESGRASDRFWDRHVLRKG